MRPKNTPWNGPRRVVMTPELKREKAAREGRATYWTGESCENGHNSNRSTKTGECIWCTEGPPEFKPGVNITVSNLLADMELARELEDYL